MRKSTEIFRQGCSFESSTSGVAHEDCRYRGHRPDRLEDRRHFARRGSRGRRRLSQKRRQHHHRQRAQRGHGRRAGGARCAAKRNRRDCRPGTSAFQRTRRPLSQGRRRPTSGRAGPRGPILWRPGRGALARAVGRGAPRPNRSRRMAPPLKSLIPHAPTEGWGLISPILCSLLVATLPFGSVLADAPKSKNAKVTLVYQHELPNCPGKSIKGVLVEYGPGGYSPGHTHAKSAFIYATVLEGAIRSQVNDGPVTL